MIDQIKIMLLASKSVREIAAELGVTRGVISGLIHRNGLAQFRVPKPKPEKKPTPLRMIKPKRKPAPIKVEPIEISSGERLGVLHLSNKTCRWPHGHPGDADFHFCGLTPKHGSPYCDVHHERAYMTVS